MTRRPPPLLAALAAASLAASLFAPQAAEARPAKRSERIELARPVRAPDTDAAGVLVVRDTRRGERGTLKLSHLDARTSYDVLDADSGDLLGTVATNRKGRAKLEIRGLAGGAGKDPAGAVGDVVVRKSGDPVMVLVGGRGDKCDPSGFEFGEGFYGTLTGPGASVSLFTDGDGHDTFYSSLCADTGEGSHVFEIYFDSSADGDLPLGVDSVSDLAGRAFDIVDATGEEVVGGDLPEMQSLDDLEGGIVVPEIPDTGTGDDRTFTAPFTLRIDDGEGTLTEVGDYAEVDLGFPDDFRAGVVSFGSWDGANGQVAMFSDDFGECFSATLFVPPVTEDDGYGYYEYSASRYDNRGSLPLDANSLDDLTGRAFELRDGSGFAFVTGTLPELSNGGGIRPDAEGGGDPVEPGAGPYTLWIADQDGTLTQAGELTGWDSGGPVDTRSGTLLFGDVYGGRGGTVLLYQSGDYETIDVSMWLADGNDFALWLFHADVLTGLPLGVDHVADLSGRAFELRNAAGDAFVSGDLPDLIVDDFGIPPGGDDSTFDPGPAPYTFWIAGSDGVLTKVGRLEAFDEIRYDPLDGSGAVPAGR